MNLDDMVLSGINNPRENEMVKLARNKIFQLNGVTDFLRLPSTIRLLRELDDYVHENQDVEGVGRLAITFSRVATYTRSPKLTRNLMDAVAWYSGTNYFEDIRIAVDDLTETLFSTPKNIDSLIEKQFSKIHLGELSKVLKLCYKSYGKESLPQLLNSCKNNHHLSRVLKFLDDYHDKQGVDRMKDLVIMSNRKGDPKDTEIYGSDAKRIITLYQGNKIVDSVAEFVVFATEDKILHDKWAEILEMPEVVSALEQFEPLNTSSNLVSCIYRAVKFTDDVGGIEPALQVLHEYHDKKGGNWLITRFTWKVNKEINSLSEVTELADYYTMPEIRKAVNACQGNGNEDKIVSCILGVGEYGRSREYVKRVANFFADYSNDVTAMRFFLRSPNVDYSLTNIDKMISMMNLFDFNSTHSNEFNGILFNKYFEKIYSGIKDEVRNTLPFTTINSLVGTYQLFWKIIEDYSSDKREFAENSFIEILNKKISYGNSLEKKRKIITDWSTNVRTLIQENIGDLKFKDSVSQYLNGGRAA